jgi:hypothetical protein
MSANIKIHIPDPATPDTVHRFRNFGQDIYRALRDSCSVSIEETDRATANFIVHDIPTKDLGSVTQTIKSQLKKHHFEDTANLVTYETRNSVV